MKKNEEYVVTCIDETNQAAGIVKIDDMVVFVPGLLKGEKANIRILKVQKRLCFWKNNAVFRNKSRSHRTSL